MSSVNFLSSLLRTRRGQILALLFSFIAILAGWFAQTPEKAQPSVAPGKPPALSSTPAVPSAPNSRAEPSAESPLHSVPATHAAGDVNRDAAPDPAALADFLALVLPDPDGVPQALAQWDDQVRVFNFWATWCPPCLQEIPAFSAVSRRSADRGVQFVGIAIDQPERVREFRTRFAVPYPLLLAPPALMPLATRLGNPSGGLPFTVILDAEGEVRLLHLGVLSEAALERHVEQALRPPLQAPLQPPPET